MYQKSIQKVFKKYPKGIQTVSKKYPKSVKKYPKSIPKVPQKVSTKYPNQWPDWGEFANLEFGNITLRGW